MSQWYYADRNRQQHGPVDGSTLARLFREGRLELEALVWREGLPQWQALGDFAGELGLLDDASGATTAAADATDIWTLEPLEPAAPAGSNADRGNGHHAVPAAHEPGRTGTVTFPAPSSPYAAPRATLASGQQVHLGGEVVHAGLWKRFAASIIDSFITGVLSYLVLIPLMLVFGLSLGSLAGAPDAMAGGVGLLFNLLMYPISIGIPALYFGWMQSSSQQASLGKMAVGIKVVRGNGEPISFWRSFLRYVAYMLFAVVTCGLGVIISGLMVAFSERKQALHDMICDTLVVDKWAFTAHPEWQRRELGAVTVAVLIIGGLLILGFIAMMVFAIGMAASMAR